MSRLGMISFNETSDYVFLGREMVRNREYSEATAREIDAEVKRLIDEAYARAKDILEKHRKEVEAIANGLLEYETLDASHIDEIIKFGEIKNPPMNDSKPPPLPPEPAASTSGDAISKPNRDFPEGGLAQPAPA
jgi:cell division protease FtsH